MIFRIFKTQSFIRFKMIHLHANILYQTWVWNVYLSYNRGTMKFTIIKIYLLPKESYLSNSFESNQLLILLVNILMLMFFFIAHEILLSISECMDYWTNQILLHLFYTEYFHVFLILTLLFTPFDDYDASAMCNLMPSIENSSFRRFRGFQEDCHKLYDPIVEWLENTYLEISHANKKFRYCITLSKEFIVDEDTFT